VVEGQQGAEEDAQGVEKDIEIRGDTTGYKLLQAFHTQAVKKSDKRGENNRPQAAPWQPEPQRQGIAERQVGQQVGGDVAAGDKARQRGRDKLARPVFQPAQPGKGIEAAEGDQPSVKDQKQKGGTWIRGHGWRVE